MSYTRFPPSFIERLRSHFLMSEVVGKRIPIKKAGREFHALCPFHNEKTPSFTINDDKGFFHCFGCAAHGDAIEFVRKYERVSYAEAIERLAADGGLQLPKPDAETVRRSEQEKTLYDVLDAATKWFESQLATSEGIGGRDYLITRGLNDKTFRDYRLGYAPDSRTGLFEHLKKAGFSQKLQADAGLIIVPESGNPYDRFRGRVIFPIRNSSGKVIAFGGRLLPQFSGNKNLPKYLNSPETELFKKGEMLYNLDLAKRTARDTNMVVVMEGYMDVVASAQSGVSYAVATLGTAVTPEHLRLLWQLAKEPVLCLDGDAAGKRAMLRAAETALPLLKPGQSVRFALLPKGEDPDSYVQKHGKASFEKLLHHSKRLSETLWEVMRTQAKLDLPEGRSMLDSKLADICKRIEDPTVRQHYQTYFKKQLWENVPKPSLNSKKPTLVTNQKTGPRSVQIEHMVIQKHSSSLEKIAHSMMCLLWICPALLHKGPVEDSLSHLEISSPGLDAIRIAFLSAVSTSAEDFQQYLQSRLSAESLALLKNNSLSKSFTAELTEHDAQLLWDEMATRYHIAHLQHELEEIKHHDIDEAAYQRMVELQNEVKKAHSNRQFAINIVEIV